MAKSQSRLAMYDQGPRKSPRLKGEEPEAPPTLKQFPLRGTAVFAPTAEGGLRQFGYPYTASNPHADNNIRETQTHEKPVLEDRTPLTLTFRARDPKRGAVSRVLNRYTGHGTVLRAVQDLMGVGRRDSRNAISFLDCFHADGVLMTPHLSRLVEGLDVDELAKQARPLLRLHRMTRTTSFYA